MAKSKVDSNYVKKETLYISIGFALVVGVLAGIVVNSFMAETMPVASQGGNQAQGQGGGLTSQQASQIMAFEQRVASNPQDVEAWTQLGHLYFDTNRVSQAIRAYNKSLEILPDNPNTLTDLGVMYRRNGQPREAIQAFENAIKLNPNHEQSRMNKGIVLMYDLGDPQGAIEVWERLLKINPAVKAVDGTPLAKVVKEAKQKN